MSGLNVDAVMERIHAELRRRGVWPRQAGRGADLPSTCMMDAALPDLERKPAYALVDFLAYSDEAFVRNVFVALLRRPPDAEGWSFYLDALRTGRLDKIEVLASIRWSEEGITRGVHVDGLLVPTMLRRWKRKPVIGPLLSWVHGLARVGRNSGQLALLESTQARAMSAAHQRMAALHAAHAERLEALDESISSLVEAETAGQSRVDALESRLAAASSELARLRDTIATAEDRWTDTSAELARLRATIETERRTAAQQVEQLAFEAGAWRRNEEDQRSFARSLDPFYVAFEQRFRGSSDVIRERMLPYVEILRDAKVGDAQRPVLDIGCGNGDWLELLRGLGYVARGVDSNRTFVELCRGRGLDVVENDVLLHLRGLPDESVGAVTGIHIAEHLPFEILIQLLDECRRVLCQGGVLALETPNPENLLVGAHYFYMDPTHKNPLPPEALRWIVEARGFAIARIERWTHARPLQVPDELDPDIAGAEAVNTLLAHLRIAPDYAVIGRRL